MRISADDYLEHARSAEGSIAWLYLDTVGVVTVGIGHALETSAEACMLPFTIGGRMATPEEIAADYDAVKAMPKGQIAANYKSRTQCRLDPSVIVDIYRADVDAFLPSLANRIPGYEDFPKTVQLALLDMGFNLGVHGLLTKFPKMMRAVAERNWKACAQECRRPQLSAARNLQTARWFKDAAQTSPTDPPMRPDTPPPPSPEPKPLTQSRTIVGSTVAATGTAATIVADQGYGWLNTLQEWTGAFSELSGPLHALAPYVDTLKVVIPLIVLAGIGVAIYARWHDRKHKGV